MTEESLRAWATLGAALIAGLFAIWQFYLNKAKDREAETERREHELKLREMDRQADDWKTQREARIAARITEFRKLQTSLDHLFNRFKYLLRTAQSEEDEYVIDVLAECLDALADLDDAIQSAKAVVNDDREFAKLNRLTKSKRFFLSIILSLARKKDERIKQLPLIKRLEERLLRRQYIAVKHANTVVRIVSIPPSHKTTSP